MTVSKAALKKEKWTLSFDPRLKDFLIREARKRGIYRVSLLEEVVRERFNPYGFTSVKDSLEYVRKIRKESRARSDEAFLREIRKWKRSNS